VGLPVIPLIPKGFIPKLDRGEFNIVYTSPLPSVPDPRQLAQAGQGQLPEPGRLTGQGETNIRGQINSSASAAFAALSSPIPILNPLNDSLDVANKLEAVVRKSPDVETVFTTVGSREGEPNKGTLYVKLKKERSILT
jgi:multidrug efflux pump subunit AcrB